MHANTWLFRPRCNSLSCKVGGSPRFFRGLLKHIASDVIALHERRRLSRGRVVAKAGAAVSCRNQGRSNRTCRGSTS